MWSSRSDGGWSATSPRWPTGSPRRAIWLAPDLYHGAVATEPDEARKLLAAMIHTAESDGGSGAAGIKTAVESIAAAGRQVEVYDYPGTHHAFFNDERPEVFDPAVADLAWRRTLDLFERRLRAPAA